MNTAVLNQQKIEGLSQEIGSENVPILLDIFLGEMDIYIGTLSELQGTAQLGYLKEISHALKSSAASFGADRLCELAIAIDKKAKVNILNEKGIETSAMIDLLCITREAYRSRTSWS